MSTTKLLGSSFLLFLDYTLVAGSNWFYWIIISRLASTSDIGQSTTIYNLVVLVGVLAQLGLEYPILKKASIYNLQIFGTSVLIVLVLTLSAIPIMLFVLKNSYEEPFQKFSLIATSLLILYALSYVSRYTLIGVSSLRNIIIIDSGGALIKFVVAYILVMNGYGAQGLLISFLFHAFFVAAISLILSTKIFRFSIGGIKYIKEILKESIVNMPSKMSWMLIFSLSTVLLAPFGFPSSEIGIFYIVLMITFVAGSFVLSMAQMVIPHSAASQRDLSTTGMRVGLSLTAPLIVALIISPKSILSLLGPQYMSAETVLVILAVGIFPFSIAVNSISKFNYSRDSTKILLIGCTQIIAFLVAFLLLASEYGSIGVASSILIAFVASSVLAVIWSERNVRIYILNCGIAILGGIVPGYLLSSLTSGTGFNHIAAVLSSVIVVLVINTILKNINTEEIKQLLKIVLKR
jgi:O-antigen/teichoic acid export membrane protein